MYIGAPGDYAQVVDVPAPMLLSGGPGGTYRIDAGLEVTVVTAARLPGGWTRFYLDQSPIGDPPVSASQLIPPVGTTYTFTVSDEATASTTITYNLKQARPFVRPRPDGKPEIGATVVETEFEVKDCSSGIAVTNPDTNTELVADCESLLGLRDTIRGTGTLNWTAGKPMSDWMGVRVSGTPQRVTSLNLADLGLDGELSGLLGELTGLTTLNLSGNPLTGMLPSKLALLTSLTNVSISGTSFTGCAPEEFRDVATSDVSLDDCGEPTELHNIYESERVLPQGTYRVPYGPRHAPLIFDVPAGEQMTFDGVWIAAQVAGLGSGGPIGVLLGDASGNASIGLDLVYATEWSRNIFPAFTGSREEISELFDRIVESLWVDDE